MIGLPEPENEFRRDFRRPVSVRMAVDGAGPVNTRERVFGASIRIRHGQQGRKIMLLGVTLIVTVTRDLEFPPKCPVLNDDERVAAREREELRAHAEIFEGDLRHHGVASAGGVAPPELGRVGEDLDEGFVFEAEAEAGRGFGVFGIEGWGEEEGVVGVFEGVERDAVLGEEGEVGVGRVVEESGGEEAASGGDKGRGGAEGGFGGDEFVTEKRGKRESEVEGGVRVDVNVEEVGRGGREEEVP